MKKKKSIFALLARIFRLICRVWHSQRTKVNHSTFVEQSHNNLCVETHTSVRDADAQSKEE